MLKGYRRQAQLVAATLVALIAFGPSMGVLADRRYDRDDVRQIGRRNGYQYGMREGRYDAQRRDRYDYKGNRIYRDGMAGYRNEFGHRGDYKDAFRDGFEAGYSNGYRSFRDSRWGGRDGWWGDRNRNDRWDDDWYRRRRRN